MRTIQALLFALFIFMAGGSAVSADPPAKEPPYILLFGNYLTTLGFSRIDLLSAGLLESCGMLPDGQSLFLCANPHANVSENWKMFDVPGWMVGKGNVGVPHSHPMDITPRKAFIGRTPQLCVLQVDLHHTGDRLERWKNEPNLVVRHDQEKEAIIQFINASKNAKMPLVLYVLGSQHTTGVIKGRDGAPDRILPQEKRQEEFALLHKEALGYAYMYDVLVAPVYLAFAELRRMKPDFSFHAPVPDNDTHISPRDAYCCAATIVAAIVNEKPTRWPKENDVFKPINAMITADNANPRNKNNPQPLIMMTNEESLLVRDAAWAALARFRQDLKTFKPSEKTR